ncbi:hypothetical protein [Flavobacterium sp.]|jgi:hypothetical protein|uniref:hypothetical protein n=1 Tax=Flavobacterium sp. TaxID=239 RepID=UPI0037C12F0D
MDTRIIIKFLITGIIILTLFFSCKSGSKYTDLDHYHGIDFPKKPSKKKDKEGELKFWINNYKQEVFYYCLFENYQNDSIMKMMGKEDLFNPNDYIPMPFWEKMKTLGKNAIQHMPENKYFIETEEDKKKKYISKTCLDYFASRELDSIAKNEYKIFKKMKYYGD